MKNFSAVEVGDNLFDLLSKALQGSSPDFKSKIAKLAPKILDVAESDAQAAAIVASAIQAQL